MTHARLFLSSRCSLVTQVLLLLAAQLLAPCLPAAQVVEMFIRYSTKPTIICAPMWAPFFDEGGEATGRGQCRPAQLYLLVARNKLLLSSVSPPHLLPM